MCSVGVSLAMEGFGGQTSRNVVVVLGAPPGYL